MRVNPMPTHPESLSAPRAGFPVLPPAMLGILGGGQLGRMFVVAAKTMGYQVTVLDPDTHSPAAQLADVHLCAAYNDESALIQMAGSCAAITTEFENVPASTLQFLAAHTFVAPGAHAVAIAQDRIAEKTFLRDAGLPVTAFLAVEHAEDLAGDLSPYLPGILKTARMGYDGKGQARVTTPEAARLAFAQMAQPCVLEKMQPLVREISAIVTRSIRGESAVFPIAENQHEGGILDVSIIPARVPDVLRAAASAYATTIADQLDYVGVLAVEFFVLGDDQLVVNEIAPRPHNSGHYTLDATATSQFQQQVRALCGLPPGDPRLLTPIVMVNLLGDSWPGAGTARCQEPNWSILQTEPDVHLHLYGKREARPGRKMGHFHVLDKNINTALDKARTLKTQLDAGAR